MNNRYLIVGGDGFLGRSLFRRLSGQGKAVFRTSRRKPDEQSESLFLDLSNDPASWEIPTGITSVFFCAAQTSIEECRAHKEETTRLNVTNTLRLTARFSLNDVPVIFPSTNLVFNGQKPFQTIADSTSPPTAYGEQKALVEEELLKQSRKNSFIRFSKILDFQTPLIRNWLLCLKRNEAIFPFSDMCMSPIFVKTGAEVMEKIALTGKSGKWQFSGKRDITYEEFARLLAEKAGFPQRLIQPTKVVNSGKAISFIPQNTTLDSSRVEGEFGISSPDPLDVIDEIVHHAKMEQDGVSNIS